MWLVKLVKLMSVENRHCALADNVNYLVHSLPPVSTLRPQFCLAVGNNCSRVVSTCMVRSAVSVISFNNSVQLFLHQKLADSGSRVVHCCQYLMLHFLHRFWLYSLTSLFVFSESV